MIKVAIVGTQGVPATYGGFESLVDNLLGDNCPEDVKYTVFCSGKDMADRRSEYKGAQLKYIPLKANGMQSVPYDIVSMCKCLNGYDVILVLGVSGCLFLPIFNVLNNKKLIINIDGQEYKREKWGRFAKRILKISEALAVRYADVVVTDNKGIQDYVTEVYHKPSTLISYGGDHTIRNISQEFIDATLNKYKLEKGKYAITVCRIEPENNSAIVLDAFSKTDHPLVYIGNWGHSEYSMSLKRKYHKYKNIHLVDAIYDLDVLYALRGNARLYVHGHSAGGTNPSLVEAMFFGIPIISYDVIYNRETTEGKAYYFKNPDELRDIIKKSSKLDGSGLKEVAERRYIWKRISAQYCDLFRN